ncbi:MAG TPA: GNAT family N-acetyltransferase, partial [Anaerolineales bacterium]|nr:GNAT family N-acetyltransferase [Anaerolineales bacterium]
IGIAPMFTAQHDGRKALLLLGSIEISDYLDLLVQPADAMRFTAGLLDFLGNSSDLQGLPMDWYNIAEASPTLQALREEAGRRGWKFTEQVYRPTPHVPLNGDFEAYLLGLDKKQRHEIRRKLRRASEGPSPAVFEVRAGSAAHESTIDEFLDLMTHDSEKAQFLEGNMRGTMRGVMHWAADAGLLWLAFLRVDGKAAAAALNFDYREKLWGYNSAVNRDFLELSPGWVLLAHQIQWACENGRTELDFMRGDEAYKYRFGAIDRHVMRAILTPE